MNTIGELDIHLRIPYKKKSKIKLTAHAPHPVKFLTAAASDRL